MRGFGQRRKVAVVAASVLGVVAFATACSSSSKSTSSTSGPSATSAAPSASSAGTSPGSAATGSTLQIGDIADETGGCLPGPTPDQGNTLKAWQTYVNSHGGIAGHQVKVTVIDTRCDPATAASAAQTLISNHALAIIDGSGLDAAFQKAVDAAKIPVLCGIQNGNGFTCQSDANFFPSGTTVLTGIYGNMYATKQAGAKSYGVIYCTEVVACKQAIPVFSGYAKELSLAFPNPVAGSETAANYTAQCLTMQQAKANALFGAGPPSAKLADDCAKQGYHPIYAQSMGTWQTAYLTDTNLNGTTGDTAEIPWFYQGSETSTFQQVEGKVLASTNYPYNVSTTYAAALLFAKALAHARANPTTTDVYNGLYAMKNETLGGFAPPLTFTEGKPTTVSCFFIVSIKNGKYVAPNGATPSCQQASSTTASS
jgi:branched-chain amino acid transport system substrate-binding protein